MENHKSDTLDHPLVIRMYVDEKKGANTIAKALGTHPSKIYDILKEHNIPRRSRSEAQRLRNYPSLANDERLKPIVVRLYCDEGLTLIKVGKRLGVSGAAVRNWMEQWGIPRRKKPNNNPKWTQLPADEVVRLYVDEQISLQEVAHRFNVSSPVIKRVLEHRGVPRRTPSEAKAVYWERQKEKASAELIPETVSVESADAPIEDQILRLRQDKNAKIQDIAHTLNLPTVDVFDVLKSAGVL